MRPTLVLLGALGSSLLGACSGKSGAAGSGVPGTLGLDGGRPFVFDPNASGDAPSLRLSRLAWGRLVDVYDVDAAGMPSLRPLLRDFVIRADLLGGGGDYTLEFDPVTERPRLIIHRTFDPAAPGGGEFFRLLREAEQGLAPILPRADDGSSAPPFSVVARNATVVLTFTDLLEDGPTANLLLPETVRLFVGDPPQTPFQARVIFDPNHGGLSGSGFHTTRVLLDLTVSEAEAGAGATPLPVNSVGLPASGEGTPGPNGALRVPTREAPQVGQFHVLRGLSGRPLEVEGPFDPVIPTHDLVRAFRSGNSSDLNQGFLLDLERPLLLGSWPLRLTSVRPGPPGGGAFTADLTFTGPCRKTPEAGEILAVGPRFLRVVRTATAPDRAGNVPAVELDPVGEAPPGDPGVLVGSGAFLPVWSDALAVSPSCWLRFAPRPRTPPDRDLPSRLEASLRFSEPMDPRTVVPLEGFRLIRGPATVDPDPRNVVVGTVSASGDLREFRFRPALPLAHAQDSAVYHFRLEGFTDLAGNGLAGAPPRIPFTVDPAEPPVTTGGVSFFFETTDELDAGASGPDWRGQFFFDFERGSIRPRPVSFASAVADRSNPVPGIMVPFTPGVQTPLSPLGSKLQTVWRYVDFGWQVLDESLYNLDVIGLAWSPIGGTVVSDFYAKFEIRLAHGVRLTQECRSASTGFPILPNSGLTPSSFAANILEDPRSPQVVVHAADLGYRVDPADRFVAASGTVMMPFPWNRGTATPTSYTWRDTRALAVGGPDGRGLPTCIEIGAPLFLEDPPPRRVRPEDDVPTFGLPLLMEFRTFPSSSAVGLNAFDISLANNASIGPVFRVFSTGGINRMGAPVAVQPDLEDVPQGGFNPNSNPPGNRTPPADNSFYIGQIDTVVRVSVAHSVWIDLRVPGSALFEDYGEWILVPPPAEQPPGTAVVVEARGADDLVGMGEAAFDANRLDPYGDVVHTLTAADGCDGCIRRLGEVLWRSGPQWTDDPDALDGSDFVQLRLTFLNDTASGRSPDLAALGLPVESRPGP